MRISCIQTEQALSYDPQDPGDHDLTRCRELSGAALDRGFALMEQAADDGADLVVTIEVFNASVSPDDPRYPLSQIAEPLDGPLIRRFGELAAGRGIYVVAGIYTSREGRVYNSAVLFGPEGRILGVFDKVHLPAGEERVITPGNAYPVFETEYGNIGMLVCWDLQYPEAARELALGGADLIVCPTWGWEKRYGLCRAYENGVSVAAAMGVPRGQEIWEFCDPSCIVSNMGMVLAEGTRSGDQIVTAEVDIRAEPAPQYGSGGITGWDSMRRIRMSQRRPDTYRLTTQGSPPLMDRYKGDE